MMFTPGSSGSPKPPWPPFTWRASIVGWSSEPDRWRGSATQALALDRNPVWDGLEGQSQAAARPGSRRNPSRRLTAGKLLHYAPNAPWGNAAAQGHDRNE